MSHRTTPTFYSYNSSTVRLKDCYIIASPSYQARPNICGKATAVAQGTLYYSTLLSSVRREAPGQNEPPSAISSNFKCRILVMYSSIKYRTYSIGDCLPYGNPATFEGHHGGKRVILYDNNLTRSQVRCYSSLFARISVPTHQDLCKNDNTRTEESTLLARKRKTCYLPNTSCNEKYASNTLIQPQLPQVVPEASTVGHSPDLATSWRI